MELHQAQAFLDRALGGRELRAALEAIAEHAAGRAVDNHVHWQHQTPPGAISARLGSIRMDTSLPSRPLESALATARAEAIQYRQSASHHRQIAEHYREALAHLIEFTGGDDRSRAALANPPEWDGLIR